MSWFFRASTIAFSPIDVRVRRSCGSIFSTLSLTVNHQFSQKLMRNIFPLFTSSRKKNAYLIAIASQFSVRDKMRFIDNEINFFLRNSNCGILSFLLSPPYRKMLGRSDWAISNQIFFQCLLVRLGERGITSTCMLSIFICSKTKIHNKKKTFNPHLWNEKIELYAYVIFFDFIFPLSEQTKLNIILWMHDGRSSNAFNAGILKNSWANCLIESKEEKIGKNKRTYGKRSAKIVF